MSTTLPNQLCSHAEKLKVDWYKPTYDYFIKTALSLKDTKAVSECLDAANGIISTSMYDYAINPIKGDSRNNLENGGDASYELPGSMRNTDFITPIRERCMGEYLELPYKVLVKVMNPDAILRRDNSLKEAVYGLMQQKFINELNKIYNTEGESKEIPDIEAFAKDFIQNWFDERAIEGQHTINLLNEITDFDTRRLQDFFHFWSTEEFYTYRYIMNNDLAAESISPLEGFPIPNGELFVEDYSAFVIKRKISWNTFIIKYQDKLSKEDIDYVTALNESFNKNGTLNVSPTLLINRYSFAESNNLSNINESVRDVSFAGTANSIDECIILFRTFVPIKLLTYLNLLGESVTIELPKDYVFDPENGDLEIETIWQETVYTGIRIGDEDTGIYIKPEKNVVQRYDVNKRTCKLPVGGKQGILMGIPRNPIPKRLAPYQAFDRFLFLQFERTIAKYKGSIQLIPQSVLNGDSAGSSKEKYFYMLADNTIVYDDTIVGYDTVTQGFRVVENRALEEWLKVLIELRAANKSEAWDLANMNDERYGIANTDQTVTNAQQNVYRAKLTTALMITMFNKALERDHNADLEFSKYAWSNGKSGTYNDKSTNQPVLVNIDPYEHINNQYLVFVRNSRIEDNKLAQFKDLAFNASQNGDTELAAMAIMAESSSELNIAIKKFSEQKRQFEQAMSAQENETTRYIADKNAEVAALDRESSEKQTTAKVEGSIEVAYINAMGFNDESKGTTFSDSDIASMANEVRAERTLALNERKQLHKERMDKLNNKKSKK